MTATLFDRAIDMPMIGPVIIIGCVVLLCVWLCVMAVAAKFSPSVRREMEILFGDPYD